MPVGDTAPKPTGLDVERIRRWAGQRVPSEHAQEFRLEVGVHGADVTIFELHTASPAGDDAVWERRARRPVAPHRQGFWLLLWQPGNRWARCPLAPVPTRDIDALLGELDDDLVRFFGW